MSDDKSALHDHRRQWRDCLYVYPVISRRARGLSIGVNLNPDKRCNFACPYCQIDRTKRRTLEFVDLVKMGHELATAIEAAMSGRLWLEKPFDAVEPALRRINDIAFSGDGEPTCVPNFDKAVEVAALTKKAAGRDDVKPSSSQTPPPGPAASAEGPADPGRKQQRNLGEARRRHQETSGRQPPLPRPDAGQNCLGYRRNRPRPAYRDPDLVLPRPRRRPRAADEIAAYCGRLKSILDSGGQIKLVQLHTIARRPALAWATALQNRELDQIAETIRKCVPRFRSRPITDRPGSQETREPCSLCFWLVSSYAKKRSPKNSGRWKSGCFQGMKFQEPYWQSVLPPQR